MQLRLLRMIALRRTRLSARLAGVNGYTGRGALTLTPAGRGRPARLSITLKGVAGRTAEIFLDNARLAAAPLENGRAAVKLPLPDHDGAASPSEGTRIEIRQNDHVILNGELHRGGASSRVFAGMRDKFAAHFSSGEPPSDVRKSG